MTKEGRETGEAAGTAQPEAGAGEAGAADGGTAAGEAGEAGGEAVAGEAGEAGATGGEAVAGEAGAAGGEAVSEEAGAAGGGAVAGEAGATGGEAVAGEAGTTGGDALAGEAGASGGGAVAGEGGTAGARAGAAASGTPAADLDDELAAARREARESLERALRAQAELENFRRRTERDLENAHKYALERFVSELLPVRDSLELGLAASAGEGADASGIAQGMELTLRMLDQAMDKFGVTTVDPAGQPFDPGFHQAMTMQESDTAESGTVLTVVQKGCLLNDRLVRPAMVIVAK